MVVAGAENRKDLSIGDVPDPHAALAVPSEACGEEFAVRRQGDILNTIGTLELCEQWTVDCLRVTRCNG